MIVSFPIIFLGSNLYTPRNKHEEVVLLLTLSEYMARKEAILSQAPEFFGMRSTKFRDAIIAYDLTAIALSRIRNYRSEFGYSCFKDKHF